MSQLPFITSVFMNVTEACNMACPYCFVKQNPNVITLQTAKDTADFLIRNAQVQGDTPSINFFGGEPLLCWDSIIVPLTHYIREDLKTPFTLSMTSNCILMDREKLEFMKANGISLLFSIDGDEETQNYNRPCKNGEPSFEKLRDTIPLVLEFYPDMVFRSTVIPETCHNLYHNIEFAVNSGYKRVFVTPNTMTEWTSDKKKIVEDEIRKFSQYIIGCYRSEVDPPAFSSLEKMFRSIRLINASIDTGSFRCTDGCKAEGKCGLGAAKYGAVDCFGNLYGCQEITTNDGADSIFYIGNIYDGVDDNKRVALMGRFNALSVHGANCTECMLNRICDGGCIAHNYLYNSSITTVPSAYCWWQQLLLNEAIYIMSVLGQEKNERFHVFWERGFRGACE